MDADPTCPNCGSDQWDITVVNGDTRELCCNICHARYVERDGELSP
jgi:hypothetical protein